MNDKPRLTVHTDENCWSWRFTLCFWQTCDHDDDEVEIAVDNAAFMDDFFCQVSVATKNESL